MRTVVLLLIALTAASAQTWGPPPGASPDYSVVYTGRLFGYFRYPDIQTTADQGCPDPGNVAVPPEVELFRATLARAHRENQELVAMGDNFAPELLARTVENKTPDTRYAGEMINKDVLTAGQSEVASDNVACFLRLMGFSAIVPGQEDFYYGPERLRRLARFLASPGDRNYRPVQMLAENLVIRSGERKQRPRLPLGLLRPALRDALQDKGPVRFELPSNVLPWLKRVSATGGVDSISAYDCLASASNPSEFKLPEEKGSNCTPMEHADADSKAYEFAADLDAGSNHALCAVYHDGATRKTHCQLFGVQHPFFQYKPDGAGATPAPYYVPSHKESPVVFGVLDPALVGNIGQLNDVWVNTDVRFDTSAQIVDPIEALRQVLELCESDTHCKDRRKILLAQMPYHRASELAAKLKEFDIVIAQSDWEHAAGEQIAGRSADNDTPYVLAPGTAFDAKRKNALSTNLRRVDYYRAADEWRFVANRVYDSAFESGSETCKTCALNERVAGDPGRTNSTGDLAKNYAALALRSMQGFCHADIALLQRRDVFSDFEKAVSIWPKELNPTPQQLLEEVLWKGDFVFCVPVKGSTLRKVLSESAAFDKQDADDLSVAVAKGRGLNTLGIQTDPTTGGPAVRGQPLEDNKLYGVAMTDFLAFGNTGYPELSTEAIRPAAHVVLLPGLNRLTGLACEQLPSEFTKDSCQSDEISAADYFDAIRQRPFDTSRGLTAWLEFRQWATHPFEQQPQMSTLIDHGPKTPENAVETRGLWWFTLPNVSIGYNLNFIQGSDRTVPGNFVGNNTFSQLSTPESSQFNFWGRARGGYSFPRWVDFYMSAEVKYARLAVRNSTNDGNFGQYQLTLGTNLLRGEVGLTSKPISGRVPIRLLISENVLTQPTSPFQQFSAALPCGTLPCPGGATSLTTFDFPKNYIVSTRIGARLQNSQSWLEGGREYGQNINVPSDYSILDLASGHPFLCPLYAGTSLSRCVAADPYFTTQSIISPSLRTQPIEGWFMNFHTSIPLLRSNLQLIADSYGEVFDRHSNDSTFNTRFYEDLTLGLKVPLWGNLSFTPQVETFFYQNQIVPGEPVRQSHYVFVSTSIALQYAFDWHRGVGLTRALRFANGVSTSTGNNSTPRP